VSRREEKIDSKMFSMNKVNDVAPFVPGRRNSPLNSMNLSDLTAVEGLNNMNDNSYNVNVTAGLDLDAFAPDPQIWNSVPGSQQSSKSSSLSDPATRQYQQQTQQPQQPRPQQQQQQQLYQTSTGSGDYTTMNAPPTSAASLSSLLGARRGSSIDHYQQQYGHSQFAPGSSGKNYKIWSNTNMEELGPWGQQQSSRDSYDLGFFNAQRRHNSLDSGLPAGLYDQQMAQMYQQQQPQQQSQQQPQQSQQSQQPQQQPQFQSQGLNFNEGIFEQNQAALVKETDASLLQVYRSLDYYFNDDPYNRVTIKDHTLDSLAGQFESMMKSGAQLPRFVDEELPSTNMVLVAFKAGRTDVFHLPTTSTIRLKIGDLVIVEADRGRDLGKILRLDVSLDEARLLKYMQHHEQQAALASFEGASSAGANVNTSHTSGSSNNIPTLHYPKPVLRFAMPNEAYQILNKQSDEEKAKKVCALKVESFNLEMRVVDAEYQWDRRKLTFYYTAAHRIDFRELVRELFRIYKTRIWMCAVVSDPNAPKEPLTAAGTVHDLGFTSMTTQGALSPTAVPAQNIWTSPLHSPTSGENPLDSHDPTLLVPRQLGSPDKHMW
jgi:hypothetical protein